MLVDRAESPLYYIDHELRSAHPDLELVPIVALAAVTAWALATTAYEGRPVIDVPETGAIPAAFHLVLIGLVPLALLALALGGCENPPPASTDEPEGGAQASRGGPVATASGLLFVGTATDRTFRARDDSNTAHSGQNQ